MPPISQVQCGAVVTALVALLATELSADTITYRDVSGQTLTIDARIAGSGQGAHALELDDGQFKIVPQGAVQERLPNDKPAPASGAEILRRLTDRFGADLFRGVEEKPYVVGLVLASPLPKAAEVRARSFLKEASKFLKNVESTFEDFAKSARIPLEAPRLPLVTLIFETDELFESYAEEATGGKGLSASNIAGFYSGGTNWLAIRLSECHTFQVPLHEAIHQLVFNRGVFQRLAPIPKWFNEGIATGFEGSGDRIKVNPQKISAHFGRLALEEKAFDWKEVVTNDRAFQGDVLAGQAYIHAWSIHWMLCTRHKDQYTKYVKALGQKQTLETITAEDRLKEFQAAFGSDVDALQKDFRSTLELGIKKQKVTLEPAKTPGISHTTANLAEVELTAVQGAGLEVQGKLRNISPLRAMAYHVTVETDAGLYADWHVPNLDIRKTVTLNRQLAQKQMQNAPGGRPRTFRVKVRSVTLDSRDASQWSAGQLPVPVYGGGRASEE